MPHEKLCFPLCIIIYLFDENKIKIERIIKKGWWLCGQQCAEDKVSISWTYKIYWKFRKGTTVVRFYLWLGVYYWTRIDIYFHSYFRTTGSHRNPNWWIFFGWSNGSVENMKFVFVIKLPIGQHISWLIERCSVENMKLVIIIKNYRLVIWFLGWLKDARLKSWIL